MQPSPLVFDGLRRCLCPGVSRASWLAAMGAPTTQQALPRLPRRRVQCAQRWSVPRHTRPYSVSSPASGDLESQMSSTCATVPGSLGSDAGRTKAPDGNESTDTEVTRLLQLRCRKGYMPSDPLNDLLRESSTDAIQQAIVKLRSHDHSGFPDPENTEEERFTNHDKLIRMTKYLVMNREMRESPFVYESLMDAMSHPRGSAQGAYIILRDMQMAGLRFTETICRSTLRALAVHPHYSLQVHILDVMRENWYALETSDAQYVVLGLLRDQQYDLAYERFLEMTRVGTKPETWVYDMMAMRLGSKQYYDEMLGIFELRGQRESAGDSYTNLVYHVLDTCSSGFHYDGTRAAWDAGVKGELFNPSDGILDNVLSTAASHGDTELAVAAYEMLSSRTRVLVEQYSALTEAFCNAGDLPGAFRILSIAEGLDVAPAATDAMIKVLRGYLHEVNDGTAFDQGLRAIKELAAEGKPVAHGLRALIREIARTRGGEHAAELLEHMAAICGEEADDETLKCMIAYTAEGGQRRALAQRYRDTISEEAQVPCDAGIYGDLIKGCIEIEEHELAMRFAVEAIGSSGLQRVTKIQWWLPRLLERAVETGDARVWELHAGITDPKFSTMKSWSMKVWNSLVKKSLVEDMQGDDGAIPAGTKTATPVEAAAGALGTASASTDGAVEHGGSRVDEAGVPSEPRG